MKVLALIPARGGSQGLPGKNIRSVGGRPLIEWTIAAALGSSHQPRVVVSTDDSAIAACARAAGASVPFMRPAGLASATATSVDTALHALEELEARENYAPDWLVLLQPTSPLRTSADIDQALALLSLHPSAALVAVTVTHHHPAWLQRLTPEGRLERFLPELASASRRQDLEPAYAVNGALYIIRPQTLRQARTFLPPDTLAYCMPPERALDIDTAWDAHLADLVLGGVRHPAATEGL